MCEVILRTVISGAVERVADLHLLQFSNDTVQELVVNALLHEYPSSGDTVLSLVEEHAADSL